MRNFFSDLLYNNEKKIIHLFLSKNEKGRSEWKYYETEIFREYFLMSHNSNQHSVQSYVNLKLSSDIISHNIV